MLRMKEKINGLKNNVKLAIMKKIYEYRNVLFCEKFNEAITREDRDQGWKDIFDYAVSIGYMSPERDYKFLRNVFWQNMRRTAQNKLDNYKNSGYQEIYCEKFTNIDYISLEILGLQNEIKNIDKFKDFTPNMIETFSEPNLTGRMIVRDDVEIVEIDSNEEDDIIDDKLIDDVNSSDSSDSTYGVRRKKKKLKRKYSSINKKRNNLQAIEKNIQIVNNKNLSSNIESEDPEKEINSFPESFIVEPIVKQRISEDSYSEIQIKTPVINNVVSLSQQEDDKKDNIFKSSIEINTDNKNDDEISTKRLKTHYLQLKIRKMELEILKLERELGIASR